MSNASQTPESPSQRSNDDSLNGLLLVDKAGLIAPPVLPNKAAGTSALEDLPYLLTSHDVVARVRKWSGQRRIGHTGTLDPMASGLLVLCLGWATRLAEYYQGHDKEYEAEVLLGAETETYDVVGRVIEQRTPPRLNTTDIEWALDRFRGTISQTPPAFSAVKQGGESVYRKARRGEHVALEPRTVTFSELELDAFSPPDRIRIHIRCSAGAYIRSLAHDLGLALGTVATLRSLRRTAAGPFQVIDAATLDQVERDAAHGEFALRLLTPGIGLSLPVIRADEESLRRFGFGQNVTLADSELPDATADLAQVLDTRGLLAGIVRRMARADGGGSLWKAEKWFAAGANADIR